MTDPKPNLEDLSVLERRGEASPAEARRLRMLLDASWFERWLFEVGVAYDRMPTEGVGDEALLDAVVRRTQLRRVGSKPKRRQLVALAASAVALLLVAGAAALTAGSWRTALGDEKGDQRDGCTDCGVAPVPRVMRAATERVEAQADATAASEGSRTAMAAPTPSAPGASPSAPGASSSTARGRPVLAAPLRGVPQAATPGELFAAANRLRKSGKRGSAVEAYERLQRSFPASAEAVMSHVLVGRLLLSQGAAARARDQFSRYLAVSPAGNLAAEALFGKASALRRLGLQQEEQRAWRLLLAQFPRSIYAATARDRLRELD